MARRSAGLVRRVENAVPAARRPGDGGWAPLQAESRAVEGIGGSGKPLPPQGGPFLSAPETDAAVRAVAKGAPRLRAGRVALGVVLAAVGISLLVAAHLYLARRLVLDPAWPAPWRGLALGTLGALGVGLFLEPVVERRLRPPWLRVVAWPFVLWMGLLWIGVNVLLAGDALIWLLGARGAESSIPVARALAMGASAAIATAGALGLRGALRPPVLRRLEIRLARWPRALDGFRIAQISDLHVGPVLGRRFAAAVVERVNALAPDLIAVTGDLVDGGVAQLRADVEPFAQLSAPHGVFFVTGNHDVYSGSEPWVARVRELGMRPLRNERVRIQCGEAGFDLAGVDDHRGDLVRGSTEDLPGALAGRDPGEPLLLLAHDPSTFKQAARLGVDLQLSGHTHGGQIQPFGALVRLVVPFVAGLYERGSSRLYVSRGTGFWGPPMRLGAPAEITEITLRCGAPEGSAADAGRGPSA